MPVIRALGFKHGEHITLRVLVIVVLILVTPFSFACTHSREIIPDGLIEIKISKPSPRAGLENDVWLVSIIADAKYKSFDASRIIVSTYEKPFFKIPVMFSSFNENIFAHFYLSNEILNKSQLYIGYGGFSCIDAEKVIKLKPNKQINQDK